MGNALVIYLPGKPKGAVECLGFVEGAIPHCVEVVAGVPTELLMAESGINFSIATPARWKPRWCMANSGYGLFCLIPSAKLPCTRWQAGVVFALYGWRMSRPGSAAQVRPFIEQYGIAEEEHVKAADAFTSFNEFFIASSSRSTTGGCSDGFGGVPGRWPHLGFAKASAMEGCM